MKQQAAIEKSKSTYIELKCDHLTTWEVDEFFSLWRPRPNAHFCETCGKWQERKPKIESATPDQPMF